jgi:predicted nucleic acid-binding protein
MICIDTSSFIAYLEGARGQDVVLVDQVLADQVAVFSPVTVSELLSDPKLDAHVRQQILAVPLLPVGEGYWERAGLLRAKALSRGRRARLADALIAQACLDHDAALVTRDRDIEVFSRIAGLRLAG